MAISILGKKKINPNRLQSKNVNWCKFYIDWYGLTLAFFNITLPLATLLKERPVILLFNKGVDVVHVVRFYLNAPA